MAPVGRMLFCQISPLTYQISVQKGIFLRNLKDLFSHVHFAKNYSLRPLPYCCYSHRSLIRRRLQNVDLQLQENKAVNLSLAAPKVNGILIRPGETLSFWHLVGSLTAKKGYREGLTIESGVPSQGIGGGMCQFTNLIHWMALHSPLEVAEHHHHNGIDLFPDFGRQLPFGVGTSIFYNYLDYRLYNPTDATFQLFAWVEGEYLCGELRCSFPLPVKYHIREEESYFTWEADGVYRHNKVYRRGVDKATGSILFDQLLLENHSRVLYDPGLVDPERFLSVQ